MAIPWTPWDSSGKNTGVGSLSLLQGIFPTQGSNPGLPHCRRILYQLSHQGSPQLRVVMVFAAPLFFPHTYLTASVCSVNSRGSLEEGALRGGDQLWNEGCRAPFCLEVKVFDVGLRNVLGNVSNLFLLHSKKLEIAQYWHRANPVSSRYQAPSAFLCYPIDLSPHDDRKAAVALAQPTTFKAG